MAFGSTRGNERGMRSVNETFAQAYYRDTQTLAASVAQYVTINISSLYYV